MRPLLLPRIIKVKVDYVNGGCRSMFRDTCINRRERRIYIDINDYIP